MELPRKDRSVVVRRGLPPTLEAKMAKLNFPTIPKQRTAKRSGRQQKEGITPKKIALPVAEVEGGSLVEEEVTGGGGPVAGDGGSLDIH